jgi:hypothetical protein
VYYYGVLFFVLGGDVIFRAVGYIGMNCGAGLGLGKFGMEYGWGMEEWEIWEEWRNGGSI